MVRRLSRDYRTKIRNIPRRINSLNRWANTFKNPERAIFSEDEHYWNFKIPVEINLVEGKYTNLETKAACAQALINACSNLIGSMAEIDYSPRITAVICIPDMFTSEICLYRSEEYFQSFLAEGSNKYGSSFLIKERSLASEWRLTLPDNVSEIGINIESYGSEDSDSSFIGERWYYGQVK